MILSCLAVSCSAKITVPVLVIANSYSLFSLDKLRTFAISIENDAFQQDRGHLLIGTMAIAIFFFGCLLIRNFNFFSQQIVLHLFHEKVRNLGNNN